MNRLLRFFVDAMKPIAAAIYPRLSDDLYLRAYAIGTNMQAWIDPRFAIGGGWDFIGPAYFKFLQSEGLRPEHRFLDFGCGSLRIGRHIIPYLDCGKYVGVDMAAGVLKAGERLIRQEGLADKHPRLVQSHGELNFSFVDERFDFILAASVFTHLRSQMVAECLANAFRVMDPRSAFYFTFLEGDGLHATTAHQPFSFFQSVAAECDLLLTRHSMPKVEQSIASVKLLTT